MRLSHYDFFFIFSMAVFILYCIVYLKNVLKSKSVTKLHAEHIAMIIQGVFLKDLVAITKVIMFSLYCVSSINIVNYFKPYWLLAT